MIFLATKKDGQFTIEDSFHQHIKTINDGLYTIEFEKKKSKRSTQQNRYYWIYLRIIGEETGDDPIELHELFKRWFLPPKFTYFNLLKKEVKLPDTTTKLSKSEFCEYIMKIEKKTGILATDIEKYG
jgi:hypothetical protein